MHIRAFSVFQRHWAWVVLLGVAGGTWIADALPTTNKGATSSRSADSPGATSCLPVAVSAGIHRLHKDEERIAPLRIVTPKGMNYYAKLVDSTAKTDVMSLYIVGGRPLEVHVPLGSYRLKYASGSVWCGESLLFGQRTTYGEAQSTFEFSAKGTRISGYTIELIPQSRGNLRTNSIRASDF